jgi:nucleotide-binding universal stress UspA family protein
MAVIAPPLVTLQNILVATDFSQCSQIALHCAAILARHAKGSIFVAHVLPLDVMAPIAGPVFPVTIHKDPRFRLKQLVSSPKMAGLKHETLLGQGDLWVVLETMIKEHHIDMVVIGTHGREGLKKLVLGSVAEEVFRRAACPVVTVGPHVAPECFEQGRLRRIMFATDFLPGSIHAQTQAVSLAYLHQASLTVVHAIPCAVPCEDPRPITVGDEEIRAARSQAIYMLPDGVEADVVVEVGQPDQVIVEVARRQEASMIVIGLHPQKSVFVAEHLPWTTAHHVVSNAHCPVMTVK